MAFRGHFQSSDVHKTLRGLNNSLHAADNVDFVRGVEPPGCQKLGYLGILGLVLPVQPHFFTISRGSQLSWQVVELKDTDLATQWQKSSPGEVARLVLAKAGDGLHEGRGDVV